MSLRCVDKKCLDGEPIDSQPAPRWAPDGLMMCHRCIGAMEKHLAETPAMLQLLRAYLGGHTTSRGDGRGSTAWPIPLNVTAHDLLQAFPAVLGSWTLLVCDERLLRGPDRRDGASLARWLLHQLDWLVQQPWVDDLADELRDLHRKADGLTAVRPHRTRLEPPCPSCSARELGRWDGSTTVDCGACGRQWDEQHLPAFVRLALDDSGGCLTAAEAATRLEVAYGTFRNLVAAGKVRKLGTVDGLARYSSADVDALVKDEEPRSA